ncbi:hypothetical protein IKE71_04180 [Candidatus Saccharibacteria bacterium]|nr:hypothetical protein [Candidatus Saccharibacteria bacterium]
METVLILTVAAIWGIMVAMSVAAVFLIKRIGEIEARKVDEEEFLEALETLYRAKNKERKLP